MTDAQYHAADGLLRAKRLYAEERWIECLAECECAIPRAEGYVRDSLEALSRKARAQVTANGLPRP